MAFSYNRTVTNPSAIATQQATRTYQRSQPQQFAPQSYYYQTSGTQQFQPAFVIPSGAPQQYQMMPFTTSAPAQQQAIFLPDDLYTQQAFQQMSIQPIQNQIRYTTQIPPAAPPAQNLSTPQIVTAPPSSIAIDSRRKVKKEVPQPVQQYGKRQRTQPVQQIYQSQPTTQQVVSTTQVPKYNEFEPQSLENCLPKVPCDFPVSRFNQPPGCFNIIRRGNLPGLSFTQVCTS